MVPCIQDTMLSTTGLQKYTQGIYHQEGKPPVQCKRKKDNNSFYFKIYTIMAFKLYFILFSASARVASYSRTCSLWKYIFRLSHGGAVLTKLW